MAICTQNLDILVWNQRNLVDRIPSINLVVKCNRGRSPWFDMLELLEIQVFHFKLVLLGDASVGKSCGQLSFSAGREQFVSRALPITLQLGLMACFALKLRQAWLSDLPKARLLLRSAGSIH